MATYGVWAQGGPKIKMDLDWGTTLGSESYDWAEAITTDTEGNIYIVGSYSNIVDFDPGEGVYEMGASNCGGQFILKLDKSGGFIWARNFGLPSNYRTSFKRICIDSKGSIILTGNFIGEIDFDLNEGTHFVSSQKEDLFVLKIDKHTNFEWVYTIPSVRIASGFSILTDKNDNILFAGFGDINSSSVERYMVFGKIDTHGDLYWSHWVKNSSYNNSHKICLDDEDNLYVATHFYGTINLISQKNRITLQAENTNDGLILKVDPEGNYIWAKSLQSPVYASARSILVDSSHNLYVVGLFNDKMDMETNEGTVLLELPEKGIETYIIKLDTDGRHLWGEYLEGNIAISDIGLDSYDNLFLAGYFNGEIDFDPSEVELKKQSTGGGLNTNGFISKWNPYGHMIWTSFIESEHNASVRKIDIDQNDNLIISGTSVGGFNYQGSSNTFTSEDEISSDILIMKLSPKEESLHFDQKINIFPNPSYGKVNIAFNEIHEEVSVNIFDCFGKVILDKKYQNQSLITIDFPLQKGAYFIAVETNSQYIVDKLLITKY